MVTGVYKIPVEDGRDEQNDFAPEVAHRHDAAGGLLFTGCKEYLPPTYGSLFDFSNTLTFAAHRLLLRNQPLVREFGREMISKPFPAINTINRSEKYQRLDGRPLRRMAFADHRLVSKPGELSLEC